MDFRAQSRIGLQIEPDQNDTTDPGFSSSAAMYDTAVQGPPFLFTPSNRPPIRYPAMHTRQPLPPHLMPTVRHKWEGAPMYFAAGSVALELNKIQLGTQLGYLGQRPIQPPVGSPLRREIFSAPTSIPTSTGTAVHHQPHYPRSLLLYTALMVPILAQ